MEACDGEEGGIVCSGGRERAKRVSSPPTRRGEYPTDVDCAGIPVAVPASHGRRAGSSQKEQGWAQHPPGMGKAVQQGMLLLRSARAPRAGKKGQDEADEGAPRLSFVERLHDLCRVEQPRIHPRIRGVAIEVAGQSLEAETVQVKMLPIPWTLIRQGQ